MFSPFPQDSFLVQGPLSCSYVPVAAMDQATPLLKTCDATVAGLTAPLPWTARTISQITQPHMSSAPSPLPALPGLLGYRHQKPFPVPSLSFLSRPSLSASLFPTSSLSRGKFQRQGLEGLHVELHADPAKMAPRGTGVCISWAQEPGKGHQGRDRRDIVGCLPCTEAEV